jgi:hypothetical protein
VSRRHRSTPWWRRLWGSVWDGTVTAAVYLHLARWPDPDRKGRADR